MEQALADIFVGAPDPQELVRTVLRLLVATLCGAIIGLQREQTGKPAGLRTHMLVATGCALFVGVAVEADMGSDELSRIIQGLVTGIGFLGAGAILKREREAGITGLTTAAGIWMTAAIGVSAGLGHFAVALLATALTWSILALVGRLERWGQNRKQHPPPEQD